MVDNRSDSTKLHGAKIRFILANIVQGLAEQMECHLKNRCKEFIANKLQFWRVK